MIHQSLSHFLPHRSALALQTNHIVQIHSSSLTSLFFPLYPSFLCFFLSVVCQSCCFFLLIVRFTHVVRLQPVHRECLINSVLVVGFYRKHHEMYKLVGAPMKTQVSSRERNVKKQKSPLQTEGRLVVFMNLPSEDPANLICVWF